jgi:hypothetical protein
MGWLHQSTNLAFTLLNFAGTFRESLWECTTFVHLSVWDNKLVCLLPSARIAENQLQPPVSGLSVFSSTFGKKQVKFDAGTCTSLTVARH